MRLGVILINCVCMHHFRFCRMTTPSPAPLPFNGLLVPSWVSFCGEANADDCIVEYLLLLWPYYIFIIILLPVRTYEIRLLPPSYPPQWWPVSHLLKRAIVFSYVCLVILSVGALLLTRQAEPYLVLSACLHVFCWATGYWVLASEYRRYQPLTWFGLRGFWLLTGFEGALRTLWLFTSPQDSTPSYIIDFPAISVIVTTVLCVLELVMTILVVSVPNDLNINLLGHIQRLLLEHPSANEESTAQPAIYTLHEDDTNTMSRDSKALMSRGRADTPGWIYSVEEELPFYPKIDVVDVFVLAVNRDRRIKTVYRIHTRVTTDTQLVVEFNCRRRYRELRFLDDRLRSVFDHSKFPEQRAGLGNFPPRELTQADPFARQIAIREYFRRLSGNPIFYTQEFLDMIGIDPRFDSGRLYESCLILQRNEQAKLPVRRGGRGGLLAERAAALGTPSRLTIEPMPWRPLLSTSGTASPTGESFSHIVSTPPTGPTTVPLSVRIPEFFHHKSVVYYKIVASAGSVECESKHRFSDFQRLAVHLKDFLHVRPTAALPRLMRIPGSQSVGEFLETRRLALQQFLQCVLSDHPSVVASRFVRTFFRLPSDLVLPATPFGSEAAEWDTHDERVTPTGSAISLRLSDEVGLDPGVAATLLSGPPSYPQSYLTSIPFFSYAITSDQPGVWFCVRVNETVETDTEWTRFHTFESFLKLKNELNLNWNNLDKGLDFPSATTSFRLVLDGEAIKLDAERKRKGLAVWLAAVLERADGRLENIEPLFGFIRDTEAAQDESVRMGD